MKPKTIFNIKQFKNKATLRQFPFQLIWCSINNIIHMINNMMDEQVEEEVKLNFNNRKELRQEVLEGGNVWSTLFFTWISHLLQTGQERVINHTDIPQLSPDMQPLPQLQKMNQAMLQVPQKSEKGMTLIRVIAGSHRQPLIIIAILALLSTLLAMSTPIITHNIVEFVKLPTEEKTFREGAWIMFWVVTVTLGKSMIQTHLYYSFALLGYNVSTTLSLLLFKKSLSCLSPSFTKYSTSEIINYTQVDTQRMTSLGPQLMSAIYTPVQLLLAMWIMYNYIGYNFIPGILTMVALLYLTLYFGKKISKTNDAGLKLKDERTKQTQELLSNIKYVKTSVLEDYFLQKLSSKRRRELAANRSRGILEALVGFLYALSCPLIIFLTFLTYTLTGNTIDPTTAFSTIMIFSIMQNPLRQFPNALSYLIQIKASIARIQQFLYEKNVRKKFVQNDEDQTFAVKVCNGNFGWESSNQNQVNQQQEPPMNYDQQSDPEQLSLNRVDLAKKQSPFPSNLDIVLTDINLRLPKGKFILLLGDIASGKSTLLLSLLNQTKHLPQSQVLLSGSTAYCSQKPWIMHGTVRNNILMTQKYNQDKMKAVLHHSCLQPDLEMLVKGELTQIGEQGTNLSGGQKSRISLARALYSNNQILLLDDVLSSLDSKVSDFIVEETILKYLKGRTVILATHATKYAKYSDEIVILNAGKVVAQGSFEEVSSSPHFQNLQQSQVETLKNDSEEEINIFKEQKLIKNTTESIEQQKEMMKNKGSMNQVTERTVQELILPQDQPQGSISQQVLQQYLSLNGGKPFLAAISLGMVGWLAFSIFGNLQVKWWCQSDSHNIYYLYIYISFFVVACLFSLLRAILVVNSTKKQGNSAHSKVISSLLHSSLHKFHLRVPVGRIMNRLTKDLRQLDQSINNSLSNFLINFFQLSASLIVCLYSSNLLMIIPILIILFLCNYLRRYYMKTQRQAFRIQAKTNSPIVSGFVSTINGLPTVRSYRARTWFMNQQINRVQLNKRVRITREALQSWFAFRLTLLSFIISSVSILIALLQQTAQPALVGLLLSYIFTLNDDIISITFSSTTFETKMISAQRIFSFMKLQPEEAERSNLHHGLNAQNTTIQQGEIEFKNVQVRYRPDLPPTLNNLTFKIKAGEKIGIVGRTGAGKTSIFSTILRFVDPCLGIVQIDGTNIKQYKISKLRKSITVIDQEATLFTGTIRYNLDPTHSHSEANIKHLLSLYNLDQLFPHELSVQISNVTLSAGQKQILCICRALLNPSKIVLIDEATANIDHRYDRVIQKVIKEQLKDSTVLIIAHRLSTLAEVDRVMVLEEGRVKEYESVQELEKEGNIYEELLEQSNQ